MQINIKKNENFEKNGIPEHQKHGIPKGGRWKVEGGRWKVESGKWKKKSIFYANNLHI